MHMHVPTCPAVVFILQAQSLYQRPWSLRVLRSVFAVPRLHYTLLNIELCRPNSLLDANLVLSIQLTPQNWPYSLQVFHGFSRVSLWLQFAGGF